MEILQFDKYLCYLWKCIIEGTKIVQLHEIARIMQFILEFSAL